MQVHYVLIDFENVHVKSLALLKGQQFRVQVFLGPKNNRLPTELVLAMKSLGDQADYIVLEAGGKNALDFHITYHLGKLTAANPTGAFYIISKDTGFDSLIKHVTKSGIHCARCSSIEALPCVSSSIDQKTAAVKVKPAVKRKSKELVDLILINLKKRKRALPRTEEKLRSTIKAIIGAQYSEKECESLFKKLLKEKYITVDDGKISYHLAEDTPSL